MTYDIGSRTECYAYQAEHEKRDAERAKDTESHNNMTYTDEDVPPKESEASPPKEIDKDAQTENTEAKKGTKGRIVITCEWWVMVWVLMLKQNALFAS